MVILNFIFVSLITLTTALAFKKNYNQASSDYRFLSSLMNDNIEFKGMTFVGDKYCPEVNYTDDLASLSMKKLSDTGANWVAVVVTEYQDKTNSSQIYPLYTNFKHNDYFTFKTETIEGLIKIIVYAKNLGLKVMLKPHIDLAGEPDATIWRGDIGKNMTEKDVSDWFISYEKYIIKYALLAEELKVEMFSVSCELIVMSQYDSYWRNIVSKIRAVYKGILTDSANHDGEEYWKTWWDVLDYIGVDAYYLSIFTQIYRNNLTNIENIFEDTLFKLRNLTRTFNKDVIITEIGFCSGNCKRDEKVTALDHFLQAEFYHWFYKIFAREKYIKGFFWWAWNSDPYYGGKNDSCISPQYKVAEQILRKLYGANSTTLPIPEKAPKCICTI
jgi:hypothetical protein